MSWFARSIANSLKFDDDDDDDVNAAQKPEPKQPENPESQDDDDSSPMSPSRGVKEDLSEISKTLSRQFWGVASFLAPPPQTEQKPEPDMSQSDQDSLLGIRSDFAEIGGKFRSGISRLSNNINVPNINVSEITKLASNFLQLESEDETDETGKREGFDSLVKGAVGVTEQVVAFARDVAMHPETWLDFPLPEIVGDDDFDLSDAQQEHALAVEQLAPRLAALRIELCPGYMSESSFWKIYFVLVHPRLDKQAAELLSTLQIVEARSSLAHELKERNTNKLEDSSAEKSFGPEENVAIPSHEEPLALASFPDLSDNKASDLNIDTSSEIVKHSVEGDEIQIVDKSIIEEVKDSKSGSSNAFSEKEDDEADDWLKEETAEIGGAVGKTIPIENEDDVSFSDLEEEDDGDVPSTYRKSNDSSDKDSRDWVRLGKSSDKENANDAENKETNDWLDIDDDIVVT